jgi:predicted ATPase/DNA-binding winged helix-turn-helix (wHTH) protein
MNPNGSARANDFLAFGPFRLFVRERRLERDGHDVKVGSRALDILLVLVDRAGEVVSNEALTARVWPDTAVEESGLRVHIAALRKALGDRQEGARYVTNVPGRGYCFVARISRSNPSTRSAPTPRGLEGRRNSLPARLERIVGREEPILEIIEQLKANRFVTVVGPGGMGKTTVAVAVVHELLPDFGGDVCFVSLASLTDAEQLPTSVASALGLVLHSDDATPSLVAFLHDRRVLLVLDSCEHVMGAVAPLAERIFGNAAAVHILATSREALRVEGERVSRMLPLESPTSSEGVTAAEAMTFPAVQLFVERAMAGGASFALTDGNAPVIASICRRLDGIPLAIELAAGSVEAYGLEGTASLLENRFKLLWHGRRTGLPRHQTLRSMLDWSYNLLSDVERIVLRRLSIFIGPFSLDAVAAVAGGAEVDGDHAIDILGSLVAKSLVSLDVDDRVVRYRLLDTTRAYAQVKLDEAKERDATARRHALYLCSVLDGQGAHSIAEDIGNARAALKWCFSDTGDTTLGAALAAALAPMFMELSLLRECHRRVEIALASLAEADRGTRLEMHLQAALGVSSMFTRGNSREVQAALLRGLSLGDKLDDPYQQLRMLGALHISLYRLGETREALSIAERTNDVAKRLVDPAARSLSDWMIGTSHHLLGDQVEAERRCRTALAPPPMSSRMAMVQIGFDARVRALVILGRALWLLGRPGEATRVATRALRDATETSQPLTLASAFVWTSSVFLWSGDVNAAEAIVEKLIVFAEKHSLGSYHHAVGLGLQGELSVKRGAAAVGIALLRRSIEALRAEQQQILQTVFATALAEGLGMVGRFAEAMATIDQSIATAARSGGSFDLPEMLRLRGHLLTTMPVPDEAEAERCLLRALDCARSQGAVAWELRAATTAARLWARQGRRAEARDLLTSSYSRFTEGLQTSDLVAAEALLSEL